MKLRIPLTGRVLEYQAELRKYGGSSGITGDPTDPVRPVPVDLGNVSWKLVSIDIENDVAEIDVSPAETITVLKPDGNPENPVDWITRATTAEEKQQALDYAKNLIEGHSPSELYEMAKCERLQKPEAVE